MTRTFYFFVSIHMYYQVFVYGQLDINQAPVQLILTEGQNAAITCCWDSSNYVEKVRVEWIKYSDLQRENNSKTKMETVLWSVNKTHFDTLQNHSRNSTITNHQAIMSINSVNKSDVGVYVCEVSIEIPKLAKGKGNGTILYVKSKLNESNTSLPALALIGLLPVPILVVYLICKRKKHANKSILEDKPKEDNTQETIELSQVNSRMNTASEHDSSPDSMRWAISTLYESCDYFAMKKIQDSAGDIEFNLPES